MEEQKTLVSQAPHFGFFGFVLTTRLLCFDVLVGSHKQLFVKIMHHIDTMI